MANDPDRNQPDRNQPDRDNPEREGDVATVIKPKVDKPTRYKVILHNDDYTTMEFVVMILMRFFHKSEPEATHIMLSVHHRGHGVCGYYPRDIAETKVSQVSDFANEHGMPLKITAEPELRGRCASVPK